MNGSKGNRLLYQIKDGQTKIEVMLAMTPYGSPPT